MKSRIWVLFSFILVTIVFAIFIDLPQSFLWGNKIKASLGLDLVGGTELIYQADLSGSTDKLKDLNNLKSVFSKRINELGVSEPNIQTSGNDKIIIELPGVKNINEAIDKIGQTYELVFMTEAEAGSGIQLKDYYDPEYSYPGYWSKTELTGRNLRDATTTVQGGTQTSIKSEPVVSIRFDNSGKEKFRELTKDNLGKRLAIVLDDKIVSAPTVNDEISSGEAIISGSGDIKDSQELAKRLNEGILPVPAKLIGQQNIGAMLGKDSLTKSIVASLFGLFLVLIFMTAYYRFLGLIGFLSLSIYALFVLAIFKIIPVTMTLAGITGFILSIGMAIDANILTFERIKEELKIGKKLNLAITDGFKRSWSSIRDSNLSSIITSLVLFYATGFGPVKAFALTLFIGIVVSMFTAIFVTRTILLLISFSSLKRLIHADNN